MPPPILNRVNESNHKETQLVGKLALRGKLLKTCNVDLHVTVKTCDCKNHIALTSIRTEYYLLKLTGNIIRRYCRYKHFNESVTRKGGSTILFLGLEGDLVIGLR